MANPESDCLPASSVDIASRKSIPVDQLEIGKDAMTHPRNKLFILQHRLQPLLQLDLLFILCLWLFLEFRAFILVDLERTQQDCRCEPGPSARCAIDHTPNSSHVGINGYTPSMGDGLYRFDVEYKEGPP
jgi:hypothetical protein